MNCPNCNSELSIESNNNNNNNILPVYDNDIFPSMIVVNTEIYYICECCGLKLKFPQTKNYIAE